MYEVIKNRFEAETPAYKIDFDILNTKKSVKDYCFSRFSIYVSFVNSGSIFNRKIMLIITFENRSHFIWVMNRIDKFIPRFRSNKF